MLGGANQLLYGRAYDLKVGPAQGGQGLRFGNTQESRSALHVAFEITKIAQGAANKGTITLFNVNQKLRTSMVKGYQVALSAGYQGLIGQLISGTVFKATSARSGPDITTTLDVIDGLKALLYSPFNRTYARGTHLSQILSDVAQAMDILPGTVMGLPDKTFGRGYVAHGLCRDILETLIKPHGLEVQVNNGKLNIIPKNMTLGTSAIVLSPQAGLLGVPSVSQTSISFEAMLNPRLVPGQMVQLVTANANTTGYFKIRSCKMTGDTHADKWSVACEGVRASNVKALGAARGFAYDQAVVPGLI